MSHIAALSTSQMGLSTSIWGYLRFFIQTETSDGRPPILYITRNMATDTAWAEDFRQDNSSNFELLCHIYYFIIMVLLKTLGPRILPPDLRENESLTNFFSPTVNQPRNFLSHPCFLLRLASRWIFDLLRTISFNLGATLWELILHHCGTWVMEYVGNLRIPPIEGKLARISEGEQLRG